MANLTLNASVVVNSNHGSLTYNWTSAQTTGPTVSTSVSTGVANVVFTYPDTIVFAGVNATSGDYSFTVSCAVIDAGVANCNSSVSSVLYFNNPLTCTMTVSAITITLP